LRALGLEGVAQRIYLPLLLFRGAGKRPDEIPKDPSPRPLSSSSPTLRYLLFFTLQNPQCYFLHGEAGLP
jgi:hypothetical protein